jgi:hypothetical protein
LKESLLISKFKEDNIDRIEIDLIAILEKEKQAEEVNEEGGDGMLVFAISSLISHLSEYIISQSEIKEEYL